MTDTAGTQNSPSDRPPNVPGIPRGMLWGRLSTAWQFVRYNARLCASLGPWLLVVPVASAMLVLFALMAVTSLVHGFTVVMVLEYLGSLVMAFVGASLLRPEYQYNTLETVLTRPVSFRKIVGVRLAFAGTGVLGVLAWMGLYANVMMNKTFDLGTALLAAAVSMAFLTAAAVLVGALTRSPLTGFLAATAFWAVDVVFHGRLNPAVMLAGYGSALQADFRGIYASWQQGKLILLFLTVVLLWTAGRAGARPAGQWNLRRLVRTTILSLLLAGFYLGSGGVYKVHWGIAHERELLNQARPWYQHAFRCYGAVPVAALMGPAFARYVGYRAPWTKLSKDPDGLLTDVHYYEQEQLRIVAFGSTRGRWVDNALYDLGRALISEWEEQPFHPRHRLGVKCLEELARSHPDSPFAPLGMEKLAHAYQRMNNPAAADRTVRDLVRRYPGSAAALGAGEALAARLRDEGRIREAIALLQPLARATASDDQPRVLLELGDLFAMASPAQPRQARAAYKKADQVCVELLATLASLRDPGADQIHRRRELNGLHREIRHRLAAVGD